MRLARSFAGRERQPAQAASAASIAARVSSAPRAGTVPMVSPVAGLSTSIARPSLRVDPLAVHVALPAEEGGVAEGNSRLGIHVRISGKRQCRMSGDDEDVTHAAGLKYPRCRLGGNAWILPATVMQWGVRAWLREHSGHASCGRFRLDHSGCGGGDTPSPPVQDRGGSGARSERSSSRMRARSLAFSASTALRTAASRSLASPRAAASSSSVRRSSPVAGLCSRSV